VSLGFSQTFTSGEWAYELKASNEATLVEYFGEGGDVAIPATIDGFPVKQVGPGWSLFSQLSSMTIPEGVTIIADGAFQGTEMTTVVFASTLTSIGARAFQDCGSLESVVIPPNVTTIGEGAFISTALHACRSRQPLRRMLKPSRGNFSLDSQSPIWQRLSTEITASMLQSPGQRPGGPKAISDQLI